jgi:putative sigma-54 modulation protein
LNEHDLTFHDSTNGPKSSWKCLHPHFLILFCFYSIKVKDGHRVEVVTNLKGTTIICKNESPDMYSSIDAAAAALNRKLCKYKERRTAGWHGGAHMGEDLSAALESFVEDEETIESDDVGFEDPGKKEIMNVNSFQLDKPITIDEAVFALDYVDHDFYVFTNEATGKINVVYKRHTGGIGLVEP